MVMGCRGLSRLGWLFLFAAALSCTAESVGEIEQAVAIPGPWDPPVGVRNAAAAQYVNVVDPPNVYPLGSCPDDNPFSICTHPACTRAHAGTSELDAYIRTRWPYVLPYGTYTCRRNSNNLDELSVHAIGRAIDAGIPLIGGDADNTLGDAVANWLIANAEYIGIQRVGWDGMWWNGERGFIPMRGDPHKNHLHIELSVDGAAKRTRFFTEGPPAETCPIVCYGNAAVAEDCSFIDCAARGEICMSDPVRCEPAGPPEPPEAAFDPGAALPTLETLAPLARLRLIDSQRVFDTRGAESARLVRSDGSMNPLDADTSGTVTSWPVQPASASGVWLNLAAVNAGLQGFVSAFPSGPSPGTSSLNFEPETVRSNAALVPFGTDDGVTFEVSSEVDLIADQFGVFSDAGLGLLNAGPIRVEDTRSIAGPVAAETSHVVDVRAPAGSQGVVATVTVIAGEPGFLRAYACGEALPEGTSLNYAGSGPVAGTVVSAVSGRELCLWATTDMEVIVDVHGYLVPEGELSYQAVRPARLLDTRSDTSRYQGRLGDGQIIELPIQSLPGAPADIQSAVLNVTVIGFDDPGHLILFPCGFDPPLSSSINFGPGRNVISTVGFSAVGDGKVCLYAKSRSHVIIDLQGVWVPTPGAAPPTVGPPPEDPNPPSDPEPDPMGGDGSVPAQDGGTGDDRPGDAVESGCGCAAASRGGPANAFLIALALLGITRRRR